jgi:hypothetical protein
VFEFKGTSHAKDSGVDDILKKLPPHERESIVPRNP